MLYGELLEYPVLPGRLPAPYLPGKEEGIVRRQDLHIEVRDGRRVWVFADGTVLPVISGGADDDGAGDDDNESEENDDGDDDSDSQGEGERKFTQSELDQYASRRAKKAERAAYRKLADELGVSIEDVKRIVSEHKEGAQGDDEQARQLEERERQAAERERLAAAKSINADVRAALVEAGLPRSAAKRVSRLIEVEHDADEDDILEAIDELKGEMPHLFRANDGDDDDDDEDRPRAVDSKARGRRRPKPKSLTGAEQAKELLQRRHPELAAAKSNS